MMLVYSSDRRWGGNREGTEFSNDMESLLGPFENVGGVLIK